MSGSMWRVSLAAAWLTSAAAAQAQVVFQPNVAAFYQHQNSYQGTWPTVPASAYPGPPDAPPAPLGPSYQIGPGNYWWEDGGGWCGTTAWVNAFYALDKRGLSGLFDHTKRGDYHKDRSWLQRMVYSNEDLAIDAGGGSFAGCADSPRGGPNLKPRTIIPDHAAFYVAPARMKYDEYYWDDVAKQVKRRTAAGDEVTGFKTIFDLYLSTIQRGYGTVVLMEGLGPWWWSPGVTGFHVVTGAGVNLDPAARTLWFADPDEGRDGKTGWGSPLKDTDPVPVGEAYYNRATVAADGRTFDSGRFDGARIVEIHTLAAVPEPATLVLCVTGMVALVVVYVRRRPAEGA